MGKANTASARAEGNNRDHARRVDVYIDLRSPYSFVAKKPIRDLARELGLELHWHPYGIDVEAAYGAAGGRDARALRKVRYIYMDARRIAAPQGLVIRGPKKIYDPALAHMGMLYAKRAGVAGPYMDAVYARFFDHQLDIEDRGAIARLIADAGGDAGGYLAFLEKDGPTALARATAAAERAGVFGVPSFVHAGELYWGTDRISALRRAVRDA